MDGLVKVLVGCCALWAGVIPLGWPRSAQAIECSDIDRLRVQCHADGSLTALVVAVSGNTDGQQVTIDVNGAEYSGVLSSKKAYFEICCPVDAVVTLVDPGGCVPAEVCGSAPPPPPPPGSECCIDTGACVVSGSGVLSGSGPVIDTTGCGAVLDGLTVALNDQMWRYDGGTPPMALSCSGDCVLDPIGTGDANLTRLELLDGTLLEVNPAVIEFQTAPGQTDIIGMGTVSITRIEHEGPPGLKLLGVADFTGLMVYDVTGSAVGSPREWTLTGDITIPDGMLLLEKDVLIDLGTYELSAKIIRTKDGPSFARGEPGARLVALEDETPGSQIITVSGTIQLPDGYTDNTVWVWE